MVPERGEPSPSPKTITREGVAKRLGWDILQVDVVTALSLAGGGVMEGSRGQLVLTAGGRFDRETPTASRNEGENHCGLLADVAAYLTGDGVPVRVVEQGAANSSLTLSSSGGEGPTVWKSNSAHS